MAIQRIKSEVMAATWKINFSGSDLRLKINRLVAAAARRVTRRLEVYFSLQAFALRSRIEQ